MTRDVALFRCDGTAEIGAGHATRCLALAEALQDAGWRITFVVNEEAVSLVPALAAGAFKIRIIDRQRDELEVLRQEANGAAELLVIDHYQRDVRFEHACRDFARQILVMDDATGRRHDCDFLVNAGARERSAYQDRVPASAELLLGPGYALVRRAFLARRAEALRRRDTGRMTDILVSFGATDPSNVTPVALDALASCAEQITITVALSSHAPHLDEVRAKLRGRMRMILDGDMPLLMSEADLAIGAAGASAYERALLGVPSIIFSLAENQREIFQTMIKSGAAIDGGGSGDFGAGLRAAFDMLFDDRDMRIRTAKVASTLIDGAGAQRIVSAVVRENGSSRTEIAYPFAKSLI